MLAWTYQYDERLAEAREAYRRSQALGADRDNPLAPIFFVNSAIRSGDFPVADELLRGMLRSEVSALQGAVWWYAISLRHQGRLDEALRQAYLQRQWEDHNDPSHVIGFDGAIMEALILLEMDRGREAAARFDSIATRSAPTGEDLRPRAARHRAWMLTQKATALTAAGDTGALSRLADSIQVLGAQSIYGRDRLLHHHVRGLLYEARGQLDRAASEFRQAVYSWSLGYTRTNLELGRVLMALHRPREAIAALRPALHGSLDASNLYVTRTEIQEQLARAFDAANERDSARVYYDRVAHAWRDADPPFSERRRFAAERAAALALRVSPR
jgi:tetratricopeptide (TPR) repeat protein